MCDGKKLSWHCRCNYDGCPSLKSIHSEDPGHLITVTDTGAYFWCDSYFLSPDFVPGLRVPPNCSAITYEVEKRWRPQVCEACQRDGCPQSDRPWKAEYGVPTPLSYRERARRAAARKEIEKKREDDLSSSRERSRTPTQSTWLSSKWLEKEMSFDASAGSTGIDPEKKASEWKKRHEMMNREIRKEMRSWKAFNRMQEKAQRLHLERKSQGPSPGMSSKSDPASDNESESKRGRSRSRSHASRLNPKDG